MPSIFPGDFRVMVSPLINAFSWTPQTLADPLANMYVKSIRYGNRMFSAMADCISILTIPIRDCRSFWQREADFAGCGPNES